MLGRRPGPDGERAYRSFISVARIADDVQILIFLTAFAGTLAFAPQRWYLPMFFGGFIAAALVGQLVVPWLIRRFAPSHVLAILPRGRSDGPATPGALRTYRQLWTRWRREESAPDTVTPTTAISARWSSFAFGRAVFTVSTLTVWLCAALSRRVHDPWLIILLTAASIAVQLRITYHVRDHLRADGYREPSLTRIYLLVTFSILLLLALTSLFVNLGN